MAVSSFAAWFQKNAGRLRVAPAVEVADALSEQLLRVDSQLGVEVADATSDPREVILTAFSDPSLFRLVRKLAAEVNRVRGWTFTALKPARGFAFALRVGPHHVNASSLSFIPIDDIHGVQILLSESINDVADGPQLKELGWLIVETGIGEELAGVVQDVEIVSRSARGIARPIDELASYVKQNWFSSTEESPSDHLN
jgi:hypothetical protein